MATDEIIELGPWGGSTGKPWKELGYPIKEIEISWDTVAVKSLYTKFFESGNERNHRSVGVGTDGETKIIPIGWPEDYLTWIGGTIVDIGDIKVVGSLTFYTNNGKIYGPYGNATGQKFPDIPPYQDKEIVGFFGLHDPHINAIGIWMKDHS